MQTNRHSDKQALDIQTKDMHKNRHADKYKCREIDMQTIENAEKWTCRQMKMQKNGHEDKQAFDIQTNRHSTYRQMGIRHTDTRHADKQTCRQV